MTLLQRVDDVQRRHRWMGLPLAVLWKFLDDEGTYLAALITYYGFVSLFPLLLLAVTVLGFVLQGDPAAQQAVLNWSVPAATDSRSGCLVGYLGQRSVS